MPYSSVVLASGPLHYWKFDSTDPVDASGNSNNLTAFDDSASGAVYLVTDDGIGGSCAYISTDFTYTNNRGFTLATDLITTDYTSGYTTEGWFKLNDPGAGNSYYVAMLGDKSTNGQGFEIYADNTANIFQYYFYGSGSTVVPSSVDITAQFDTWIHAAMTVTATGDWKMYHNGIEVLNGDSAIDLTYGFVGTDGAKEMMDGKIDEVAFYNRVLSASELLDHYNAGITALA